jgi:hypothetical protein
MADSGGSQYPRNAPGTIMGPDQPVKPGSNGPDLILTFGDGGTTGYLRREDLGHNSSGAMPANCVLPLLTDDGLTQIGTKSLS